MNTALILAGGVDSRFQMDIPKQFVNVNNRPIIVYTLEIFQNHPEIDEIMKVQTPQTFHYSLILSLHERVIREQCVGAWDNSSMITKLGEKVYFSEGSGLSAVRCQETIVRTEDGISGSEGIARAEIMRVQTPQAYRYGKECKSNHH